MDKAEKDKVLQELGNLPEEIYNEIGRDFVVIARRQAGLLAEAAKIQDLQTIAGLSHTLKGSSGNLRLRKIQALAIEIEQSVKKNDTGRILDLVGQLPDLITEIESVFTAP